MDPLLLTEVELRIGEQYLHGHVRRVLDLNPGLEASVVAAVSGRRPIVRTERKRKGSGLTAGSLNTGLKREFERLGGWSFEATVREGVIFDSRTLDARAEGFDLARYDAGWNVARLWSYCFGSRPIAAGANEWKRARQRRPDLDAIYQDVDDRGIPGADLVVQSVQSVVFGDIQFGNWGLGYRDMLRLIDADDQLRVDLFVYVTGSSGLNAMLSDGIVTFDQTKRILEQFPRLLRVPVWVVGLDAVVG